MPGTHLQLRREFGTVFHGRRVLVTGASGFLGRHLCRALDALGAHLHGCVRDVAGADPACRRHRVWHLDVRDLAGMRRTFSQVRPEVVFHLAGYASARPSIDLVLPMLEHNLLGSVHALLAAAEYGCDRFVMVSSAEEIRGSAPASAVTSPYGAAKLAATAYGRFFHRVHGVPVVLTRPLMAYGPGQHSTKLIPYVVTSLLRSEPPQLSTGSRLCDFVYVADVIRGFLLAATKPHIEGQMLEFGSGHVTAVREVVNRLATLSGAAVSPAFGATVDRPEEPMEPADLETTRRLIEWGPRWSLDEGLAATIAYYRGDRNTTGGRQERQTKRV
jgi:nucleoside-diphosphate-sugar epimerase